MNNNEYLKKVITSLSQPLEYKWKLQSYTKDKSKAMCVAYIDARIVIQRLNEVCEYGWHREHFALGNDKYCRLGVIMPDGSVVWRSDVGDSDNETETSKTAASDSFKRAAVQFGLGLFLYDLDIVKLPTKQSGNYYDVVDDKGNKIWDLTDHINKMLKSPKKGKTEEPKKSEPVEKKAPTPSKELPELLENTPNFEYAKKRLKEGVTLETIKKNFRISEDIEKKLKS
jgi:hypothetical protein